MAGRILLDKCSPALDDDGDPDATGVIGEASTLLFRLAGSTTELNVYTTIDLDVPHPNPLVADDAGRFPQIWAPNDALYDIVWERSNGDQDTLYNVGAILSGANNGAGRLDAYVTPLTDLTNPITASSVVPFMSYRIPFAWTMTEVPCFVHVAQTSGALVTFDVKADGVSIFTTKPTIDNGEESSDGAGTPAVLATTSFARNTKFTFFVTQIGDGTAIGAGASLAGYPTA